MSIHVENAPEFSAGMRGSWFVRALHANRWNEEAIVDALPPF